MTFSKSTPGVSLIWFQVSVEIILYNSIVWLTLMTVLSSYWVIEIPTPAVSLSCLFSSS
jgi:hypothetical protein